MMANFDPAALDKKGKKIYAAALEELEEENGCQN